MEAIISGQASALALIDGGDCYVVHANEPSRQQKVNFGFLKYIFSGVPDVQYFSRTTPKEACERLLGEVRGDEALRLSLILFDEKEEMEVRKEAAAELEILIADPIVIALVENVLYSSSLPVEVQISSALRIASSLERVTNLVAGVRDNQESILRTALAWESLPDTLFDDSGARAAFRYQATKRGVFLLLAKAVSKDSRAVNAALIEAFSRLKDLPNYRALISAWTAGFKGKSQDFGTAVKLAGIEELREAEKVRRKAADERPLDGHAAFQNVLVQQEAILHQIRAGNTRLAQTYMDQLVETQLRGNQPELAAKTLCRMAQEANACGHYSLQLDWAKRASELSPLDRIAFGHLADAYIFLNRFNEALEALQRAEELGDPRFANTERARILRLQGRLDEALADYEKLKVEFGTDEVNSYSWKGYAEVLRDMSHLDAALAAYKEAANIYPHDNVISCGMAAVLADLGHMEEARATYDRVLQENSTDDIALNGKAVVLKEQGHLLKALELFEKTISSHPAKPYGTLGKATVLKGMQRGDEALALLRKARRAFPNEPLVLAETAEVLRGQNKLSDALKEYDKALQQFPWSNRLSVGYANILKELGQLEEALRAYDQNIARFPYDVPSHHGRADLLKRLRDFDAALGAYDEIMRRWPERSLDVKQRKAAVLVALERYSEAETLLPTTAPRTMDEWVGSHIRGMILLKTNRFSEAISHFEKGLASVPYARHKGYFKNALAVAYLRQKQFRKASNVLPSTATPVTNILQLHAWAGEGKKSQAVRMLQAVERNSTAQIIELGREIARCFGIRPERPKRNDTWIHRMECELVLLEAA